MSTYARTLVVAAGLFEMFALAILVANAWFVAMLNGGELTITIDAYGEMWVEYVAWLVTTPVMVYALAALLDGDVLGDTAVDSVETGVDS